MTIDKKRLATDAAYWDEVAPEGATHYWPQHKAWYQLNSEGLLLLNPSLGSNPKRCLPNIIEEPGMIRRPNKPAAPEWDGEGLPPVGCECEIEMQVADQDSGVYLDPWRWCEILAHRDDCAIVWVPSVNKALKVCNRAAFRPIRTKEQRDRDELVDLCIKAIHQHDSAHAAHIADAILSRYNLEPKK